MSVAECSTIFAPLVAALVAAALIDVGRRMHGGAATPTPVFDYLVLTLAGLATSIGGRRQ